ncbi:MAG: hypothetical protein WKH97_00360 [Casimicrobiaceae bacterium]
MLAVGEESVVEGIPDDVPVVPLGDEPVVALEPDVPGDAAIPEVVEPVELPIGPVVGAADGAGAGLGVGATAGVFDVVTGGVVSRLSQADKPNTSPILQIPIVNVRMIGAPLMIDALLNFSSFDAIKTRALISMKIRSPRAAPTTPRLWKNYRLRASFASIFARRNQATHRIVRVNVASFLHQPANFVNSVASPGAISIPCARCFAESSLRR